MPRLGAKSRPCGYLGTHARMPPMEFGVQVWDEGLRETGNTPAGDGADHPGGRAARVRSRVDQRPRDHPGQPGEVLLPDRRRSVAAAAGRRRARSARRAGHARRRHRADPDRDLHPGRAAASADPDDQVADHDRPHLGWPPHPGLRARLVAGGVRDPRAAVGGAWQGDRRVPRRVLARLRRWHPRLPGRARRPSSRCRSSRRRCSSPASAW